jgi:protein-tyrosine phosphatase
MLNPIRPVLELFRIIRIRLKLQGWRTTIRWLYTVGVAKLTGRVSLRYSRVTPNLYIGPQYGRRGKAGLERAGINAAVSLRAEYDDLKHGLALTNYRYLPTIDNTPLSLEHLQEGAAFIDEVIDRGESVYVHCGSGVGRAPSMAAAYLMSEGLSLDEAVKQIQKARPFVRILPEQLERLREFEAQLQQMKAQKQEAAQDSQDTAGGKM